MSQEYNGWSNYDTWQANLWVGEIAGGFGDGDSLEEFVMSEVLNADEQEGLMSDILNAWARSVDWDEIVTESESEE